MNSIISNPVLTLVIPCYNEEEVLTETISRLTAILEELAERQLISKHSKMLFVDDGSRDKTWNIIASYNQTNPYVSGLKLAKNAGHQNALLSGLMEAKETSDCVISVDADLQDDLNAIQEFVIKFKEGYDIVYGVRKSRATDTFFKRSTAQGFYRVMSKMGVNIVYNHADYRLMSKRVLQELSNFKEVNLFLRGLVPLIGYRSTEVYYDRHERFAGESKYPLKKMLAFAFDGITSFSVTPIRLVSAVGFAMFGISLLIAVYTIISKLLGTTVWGWSSLMLSIWFIGGLQLVALGLIGEYIGKIYKEVKQRPKYIVETILDSQSTLDAKKTTSKNSERKALAIQ
ncbi:glycosyltransferase family 2 protein [Paenibacillus farraposensis]|uniref:Glycosyltransferase family 2 protein n=1 Tax=Paenibacillus farraposensis TaxID=2807095 RepID=A0ABW4DEV3_9BACL|nr:glycosyltransferase family 2 protein [Paenibacillus farraposensis]MCC3378386.1 glycosyltransferase family 2 protein [Paenibacillus farraposensis]